MQNYQERYELLPIGHGKAEGQIPPQVISEERHLRLGQTCLLREHILSYAISA